MMGVWTRRQFLQAGAASAVLGSGLMQGTRLMASPFGLPVGLQLYSVRAMLPKDPQGTLDKIAALGYTEVEAAGFFDHTAEEVKAAMNQAGLRCVSAHYSWTAIDGNVDKIIAYHKELGAEYIICSFPGYKNPAPPAAAGTTGRPKRPPFTMEDWVWNAEQFNKVGKQVNAAGLKFGYHNHTMEFAKQDGKVPFDELLRLTDPAYVTMELDCGWVSVGGGNPVDYLKRFPDRISMLHVKDFKKTDKPADMNAPPPAAELGRGTTDFRAIFAAADRSRIKHYFVEQEEFDMDPWESLKIDEEYMKNLTV